MRLMARACMRLIARPHSQLFQKISPCRWRHALEIRSPGVQALRCFSGFLGRVGAAPGAGCGQARDNCAQDRRHDLRRIVLVLELAPMAALRACERLPETA